MKSINLLKRKDGMALLTVMLIFLVLSLLLGGVVATTNSNLRQSVVTKNHTAAFYASESGLTKVSANFEKQLDSLLNQTPSLSSSAFLAAVSSYITSNSTDTISFTNNNGEASYANMTLADTGIDAQGYHTFTLTSSGFVGDVERVLVKTYRFKYTEGDSGSGFVITQAILAKGNIIMDSGDVYGAPIATYSTNPNAIQFGWGSVAPSVQIPQGTNKTSIVYIPGLPYSSYDTFITEGGLNGITYLDEIHTFPEITMPGYPNKTSLPKLDTYNNGNLSVGTNGLVMSGWTSNITYTPPTTNSAYYVPNITIANNSNFTINIGNSNVMWVTDKIVLNGPMQIVGTGTLTIYLTGNAGSVTTSQTDKFSYGYTGGNGYIGHITNPERIKILIDPLFYRVRVSGVWQERPVTTTIGGSSPLYIALMAANLNLNLTGSGKIDGYVVTGGTSVTISGGSSTSVALYYAPNAQFTLSGSGQVNGAIIANNFQGGGGTVVQYSDVLFDNFPFEILDPITGGTGGGAPVLELLEGSTIEQ